MLAPMAVLSTPTDALLEQAFDAAGLGLAVIDATGRTVRVNPALAALLGRDEAEVRAAGLQQVLGEATAASAGSALVLARPDGTEVHVRLTLAPLAGGDGDTSGVLAQLLDIGEREQAAERERVLLAELASVRERSARQLADLRRVVEVQHALSEDADVRQAVCDVALEIGGAVCAAVFERDGDTWLRSTATAGLDGVSCDLRADQPSGVAHVLAAGQRLYVDDAAGHAVVAQALVARFGVGSLLYEPVQRDGETVAVLVLGWRETRRDPSERIVAAAQLLAGDLAVGLRRAEHFAALEAATTIDPESGLLNARGWDGALYLQLARGRRSHEAVCVALLELADAATVSARVAGWREELRVTDALARIGPTRVAVLLAACDLPEARTVLERMEPGAAHGVVQWDGAENAARLLERADAELYAALARRHAGRLRDGGRLAAVQALAAVRDHPLLHELAQAAATAVDARAVAVCLVDGDAQVFAGQHGIEGWAEHGTPLAYSYCQYPTVTGRALVLPDAREHPLLRDSPAVQELEAIAYAGIPLRDADGHVLGALCAIEPHPRAWLAADVDVLAHFADLAAGELQRLAAA
jgi:GAF domain-containing protein